MNLPVIASLWIGDEVSWVEQVCLKSFVDHGHRVILYTYGPVGNIPEGIEIADATEILPGDEIIRHARTGSPAYHADKFRLRLMEQTDYVWVDTDAYCHQPFLLPEHGHLHGYLGPRGSLINNGVLRLPKDSETLRQMVEFTSDDYPIPPWFREKDKKDLRTRKDAGDPVHVSLLPWGVWGPNALTHFLGETGENRYSLPQEAIYPVPFENKAQFFRPAKRGTIEAMITDQTISVHLWGRRFRRVATGQGGAPLVGSYASDICVRHGIDPIETQHLLIDTATADGQSVSFASLGDSDLVNLCLQRSEIVRDNAAIKSWVAGDAGPLNDFVTKARKLIPAKAFSSMLSEFEMIKEFTDDLKPTRIADIGCGYAFLDLILWRTYGCEIVLIDIEESEERHFGFEEQGAGYTSLEVARAFLIENGVPKEKITLVNPQKEDAATIGDFDLATSFLSCGFHYGLDTYGDFFRDQVREGGAVIVDVRKGSRGVRYLKSIGKVEILGDYKKHAKVAVTRTLG